MLYGNVRRASAHWVIRCEPQVRARLKRVFARAPQEAADYIAISDTPENSRDLLWFLQRYPMEVDKRDVLEASAGRHVAQEARLAELLERRVPPMDIKLAEPARDYQAVVPQYLDVKDGLLLGDDVGVGKTVSGICCLQLPDALPAVIVVPPHLAAQWQKFFRRFMPSLSVHVVKQGGPETFVRYRKGTPDMLPLPDVVIVSYFRLRQWAETLGAFARTVIFEECQQLRNPGSLIYQACEHLASKVKRRLGLSATPIYNYGSEFFWVVDALMPGVLGSRDEFVREWCTKGNAGEKARLTDPEQFGAYLRREGIMLRRTRREVNRELPPVSKVIHEIDADLAVLEKMTGGAIDLAKTILRSNERYRGEKMHASAEFDNLMRQATGVAKAPYVAEFVRLLLENGERIVLFGWHRAVYGIWLERLADFKPVMYTGSEGPKEKAEAERKFKERETNLFIMSLRSGAGVDGLQESCRTAVFGELDWSPGVHTQCIGRLDRDGQLDPVSAYFLVSNDGSDPIITDVLGIKREQIEGVNNPGGGLIERVNTGDNSLRQLARDFLQRRGVPVPPESKPSPIVQEPA